MAGLPSGFNQTTVDATTRERLVAENLPLVRRLCRRYRYSGVAIEDLVQVGSLGLVKAIDKYDSLVKTRFEEVPAL